MLDNTFFVNWEDILTNASIVSSVDGLDNIKFSIKNNENIVNLLKSNYFDSFYTNKENNKNYLTNFFFEHFSQWMQIYLKKLEFLYLYPLQPTNNILFNKSEFLFNIIFSENYIQKDKINDIISNELSEIKKISPFLIWSNFNCPSNLIPLLNNNNFYLYTFFVYNNFDFEVLLHSLFSMWYPYGSAGLEDQLLNLQTSIFELNLSEDYSYYSKNIFLSNNTYLNDHYFINPTNIKDYFCLWWKGSPPIIYMDVSHFNIVYNPIQNSSKSLEIQEEFNNYFKTLK